MNSAKKTMVLVLALSLPSACKRDEPAPQPTASPSGTAATTALAVATATAAAAATTAAPAASTEPIKEVCPLPRRCSDACKKAHFAAMDTCAADWKKLEKAYPNVKEGGECTARCLTSDNRNGCVGAATTTECDCIRKCFDGVPAADRHLGDAYFRCYVNATAACY